MSDHIPDTTLAEEAMRREIEARRAAAGREVGLSDSDRLISSRTRSGIVLVGAERAGTSGFRPIRKRRTKAVVAQERAHSMTRRSTMVNPQLGLELEPIVPSAFASPVEHSGE